jgi:large subunit ribosomal protein L21
MKYAVIKTGGKQYRVAEGDEIEIEKIDTPEGKTLTFDEVLLLVDDKKTKIGQPKVARAKVKAKVLSHLAKVLSHLKGKKIRVATYKAKSRYRRVKGHRQQLTRVKISSILSS